MNQWSKWLREWMKPLLFLLLALVMWILFGVGAYVREEACSDACKDMGHDHGIRGIEELGGCSNSFSDECTCLDVAKTWKIE